MADNVIHFGFFVRWERERRGWARAKLGEDMARYMDPRRPPFSEKRLWEIEGMPQPKVRETTKAAIAAAFGYDAPELDRRWKSTLVPVPDADRLRVGFEVTPYEHEVLTAYAKGQTESGNPTTPVEAAKLLMLESLRTKKEWVKAEGELKSRGATSPTGSGGSGSSRRTRSRTEDVEDASPPLPPRTDAENRPSQQGRKTA